MQTKIVKLVENLKKHGCHSVLIDFSQKMSVTSSIKSFFNKPIMFTQLIKALNLHNIKTTLHITISNIAADDIEFLAKSPYINNITISENNLVELAKTKLAHGFERGASKIILLWTKIILSSELTNIIKGELLVSKCSHGFSGLYKLLHMGHIQGIINVVGIYCQLVIDSNLPDDIKQQLLIADNPIGTSGLLSMINNQVVPPMIEEYRRTIQDSSLPDIVKDNLLTTTESTPK